MIEIRADNSIPEDAREKKPEYWIESCLEDLFFLSTVVMSFQKTVDYRDLNWVHRELCDFLDPKRNPVQQLLVLMSRDMLKSSIGRAMMVQWFLQKAYRREQGKAFIFSGVFDLAQDHLEKIVAEILKNPIIQGIFAGFIPKKKEEFDVCRVDEGKIRYRGIELDVGSPEKSLTGRHYELGMVDNLANEVNTQTVDMRKKTNKRWQQLESVFAENAREVVFETTWAIDDVSGIILHPEAKFDYKLLYRKPCLKFISETGYAVFSCPAATGKGVIGDPVFPEKVNIEYLERKRRKQGPYLYGALYELQPMPEEDIVIRPEWWDVHYQNLPGNFIRNICVDAAGTTKKRSSYSGLSIGEWDEAGVLYLPYASRRKISPLALETWILQMIDMSKEEGRPITWLGIEKEKYGIYLKDSLSSRRKDLIIILWEDKGMSKGARHEELVPHYESRRILCAPGLTEYEDEMKTYYKGKEEGTDILDTVWGHFQIQLLPKKLKEMSPQERRKSDIEKEIEEFEAQAKEDIQGRYDWRRRVAKTF